MLRSNTSYMSYHEINLTSSVVVNWVILTRHTIIQIRFRIKMNNTLYIATIDLVLSDIIH